MHPKLRITGKLKPTACPATAKAFEKSGRDYFYQCHLCTALKTKLLDLLKHQSSVHKFKYRSRTFKHLELEPDPKDPNFYCRVCETTYPNIKMFKKHFRLVHYMITRTTRSPPSITPLQAIKAEKEYLFPDRDDPNNHCRTCNKSYVSRLRYLSHLAKFHDMPKFKSKQGVLPDIFDPHFYCKSCDRGFGSKPDFRKHCLRWHNLIVPADKDLPSVHDPTFHCKPCDSRFEDKDAFWQHCRQVHHITNFKEKRTRPFCDSCKTSYINEFHYKQHRRVVHGDVVPFILTRTPKLVSDLPPDVNDPNHYCRACDKKLAGRAGYRTHLSLFHDMVLPLIRKTSADPTAKRYIFHKSDTKYHCRTCDKGYPTTIKYREHLEHIHHIQGAASETRAHIPSYLPDPDDPNFYCRTCGKTKQSLEHFRKHLRNIHHMALPKLERKKKLHYVHSSDDEAAASPRKKTSFSFYKCPECNKKMKSERRFAYHTRTAHKAVVKEDPDAPNKVDPLRSGVNGNNACGAHVENDATGLEHHHVQQVHTMGEENQVAVAEDQGTAMTDFLFEEGGGSCFDSVHSNHTPEPMDEDEKFKAVMMNDDLSETVDDIDQALETHHKNSDLL